jgi:hypothetical protein
MHKTPPGSSKNAQNPMRNFQKGTKSNKERFSLIAAIAGYNQFKTSSCNHEYPGNTAKVDAEEVDSNICLAKISLIMTKPDNFYDMINITRNFQKCTTLYEELTKMHKIPRGTSKYAQNPTMIFQKCTKSHD